MSLQSVVNHVVNMSGRREMGITGHTRQSELIIYINAASRMLDEEVYNFKQGKASKVITLYPGMYFVTFSYAKAIREVWVSKEGGLSQVDIVTYSLRKMREQLYGEEVSNIVSKAGTIAVAANGVVTGTSTTISTDGAVVGDIMIMPNVSGGVWTLISGITSDVLWTVTNMDGSVYSKGVQSAGGYFYIINAGSIDRGTPIYGAVNIIRRAPDTALPLPEYDSIDLISPIAENILLDGIMLYPPPDVTYTLRLDGDFYSGELSALTDVNYWTEIHGGILLAFKTMQLMEGILRNMTGSEGYKKELADMTAGLKRVAAAQQRATVGNRQKRFSN